MVKKKKAIVHKRAIAMIELIFSIVIMGIVLLSAPMLIQQSIKSGNIALQQEAIAAAASQTSVILSMHWDENNNSNTALPAMFNVNRAPFDFNNTRNTVSTPFGLIGILGRKSTDASGNTLSAVAVANLGTDTNESNFIYDDVDDYHNQEFNLTVFNSETTDANTGDYIDTTIVMNTTINYTEDRVDSTDITALSGTKIDLNNSINSNPLIDSLLVLQQSNIKFIHINLTSKRAIEEGINELDKNITFEAFSCNIGTTMPQGRSY